jgi:hypothetical protein
MPVESREGEKKKEEFVFYGHVFTLFTESSKSVLVTVKLFLIRKALFRKQE